MEDVLAVALETEVARLDDASVDRPDRHFVNFLAAYAVEIGHANGGRLVGRAAPGVFTCLTCLRRPIALVKAHRFPPGMAFGDEAPLLAELAFEQVHLGAVGRHGREGTSLDDRAGDLQLSVTVAGQHGAKLDGSAEGAAVKRDHAAIVRWCSNDRLSKVFQGHARDALRGNCNGVS